MKIELTEEEREILLGYCERAIMFKEMILHTRPDIIVKMDIEKIETLINKLSEKKCENS